MKRKFLVLLGQEGYVNGKVTNVTASQLKKAAKDHTPVSATLTGDDGSEYGEVEFTDISSKGGGVYTAKVPGVEFDVTFSGGKATFEAETADNFEELHPQPNFETDVNAGKVEGTVTDLEGDDLKKAAEAAEPGNKTISGVFSGKDGEYKQLFSINDIANTGEDTYTGKHEKTGATINFTVNEDETISFEAAAAEEKTEESAEPADFNAELNAEKKLTGTVTGLTEDELEKAAAENDPNGKAVLGTFANGTGKNYGERQVDAIEKVDDKVYSGTDEGTGGTVTFTVAEDGIVAFEATAAAAVEAQVEE